MEQRSTIGQIIGFLAKLVLLVVILAAGLIAWGTIREPNELRYTQLNLESRQWPAHWQPLRVVLVTDLHVGAPFIDQAKLEKIVEAINHADADVVLLVGSFMPGDFFSTRILPGAFAPVLGQIKSRYGVFALPGRQDAIDGGRRLAEALKEQRISVLSDSAVPVKLPAGRRFWVVGLGDDARLYDNLVSRLPRGEPAIAMVHNPARFPYVPGKIDLVFAGYTHGGLVYIPNYPLPFVPAGVPKEYAYGLIRTGDQQMYVSAGIGTNEFPIRLNNRPEIVVATITAPQ